MKYYCKIILLITLNKCQSFKIWINNISIISHRHINPLLYHISDIINNKKQHRISGHKEENSDLPATLLNIWFAIDLGWENVHNELQFLAHQHLLYHNQLMNYIWFGPLMYVLCMFWGVPLWYWYSHGRKPGYVRRSERVNWRLKALLNSHYYVQSVALRSNATFK